MSTLVKLNPFGEVDELQSRLDRFFFNGFPNRMRFPRRFENGEELRLPDWSPLVDITEDDHEYLFKADLPEMKKEDVKITVEKGILFKDGLLKVHLPKLPIAKVKPIEVKVQ